MRKGEYGWGGNKARRCYVMSCLLCGHMTVFSTSTCDSEVLHDVFIPPSSRIALLLQLHDIVPQHLYRRGQLASSKALLVYAPVTSPS
jgi:hypothetical protein